MNEENEFEYNNEEAADVILQNISTDLQNKLDFEDIIKILELKDEYFKKVGIIPVDDKESICDYPIDLDEEAMNLFIISNAVRDNIILTMEEMVEIMDAELIYLDINGQLDDPTHLN
jgi:hypothetical protein